MSEARPPIASTPPPPPPPPPPPDGPPAGNPALDERRQRLELARLDLQISMAEQASAFFAFDADFNQRILTFTDLIIDLVKKDPTVLVRPEDPRLDDVIELLRVRAAGGGCGGATGAGVSGGDAQQVVDIIRQIVEIFTSVVGEEKKFFLEIIRLLLCGCRGTGW